MYKLDRKAIRKALQNYLKAKREFERLHNEILNDNEVQNLYKKEMVMEARRIIREKYPDYSLLKSQVHSKGIELIQIMTKGIPDFEGIEPEKIYRNYAKFSKLVNLARLV